ncbi:hypothetical protein BD769DRAFT_1382147 [Suillus cothurnatus]|nr:hypothetical protein BD769DRAFT_1382147 [Suillus cothurnatus]
MTWFQKRLISTVRYLNNAYAGSPDVRRFIQDALTKYCASSGLDAQGAEAAEIPVTRSDGTYIQTMNPYTLRPTLTHHYYIARDQRDLDAQCSYQNAQQVKDHFTISSSSSETLPIWRHAPESSKAVLILPPSQSIAGGNINGVVPERSLALGLEPEPDRQKYLKWLHRVQSTASKA